MPITEATIADVAELTALINSAYRGESSRRGWTSEGHLLDGTRIDEPTMVDYLQDEKVTILKYIDESGMIKGTVYLEKKDGELYLGMLSVWPDGQAQGIGRQLLKEAEVLARRLNLPLISMTVISVREELINWYIGRGYKLTGEVQPFHIETKFGIARQHIELLVLKKDV